MDAKQTERQEAADREKEERIALALLSLEPRFPVVNPAIDNGEDY